MSKHTDGIYDAAFFDEQERPQKPRDLVRQKISAFCATTGKSHSLAWRTVYLALEDQTGFRVPDKHKLDAIEEAGLMAQLLEVARDLSRPGTDYASEVNNSIPEYSPRKTPEKQRSDSLQGDSVEGSPCKSHHSQLPTAVQFNWRRHWKKKVEPHLQEEVVQAALDLGMMLYDPSWKRGHPPHLYGGIDGRRIVQGKLSWYQPIGRCHWIAFFSMAIGVLNYPDLDWRFVSGELHTVPVGYDHDGHPKMVMDILLFDRMSAEESLANTQRKALPGRANPEAARQFQKLYRLFTKHVIPEIRKRRTK